MTETRHGARRPRTGSRGPQIVNDTADALHLSSDVLVIGGGPAATWAAITAADAGATVVLVDKGYCGTSGAAATAGVNHWLAVPDSDARDAGIRRVQAAGEYLSDTDWMNRILDRAWQQVHKVAGWGWDRIERQSGIVSLDLREGHGSGWGATPLFSGPAPDYLRFLRGRVKKSGGLVLDHSPATQLLRNADTGQINGAEGVQRQLRRTWRVRAKTVILATGGTTWKSHSQGGDVNTGDGQLMAAEAGATLSGMEFSNFQGMVPWGTSMDKNGFFIAATYWDAEGREIPYTDLHKSRVPLLAESLKGTISAQFTQFAAEHIPALRAGMPNFFMVTDKLGIDPFRERFPMDWVNEGTVRGTGGIFLDDTSCRVPGVGRVYAAGDVAARDRYVGASTGAGGPNLSWAVASGSWAGEQAAREALGLPDDEGSLVGTQSAIRDPGSGVATAPSDQDRAWLLLQRRIQDQMLPIDKAVFRSDGSIREIQRELDSVWADLGQVRTRSAYEFFRFRELAGMAAMARWAQASALARRETRGMHYRTDYPTSRDEYRHRLRTGGLDEIWVAADSDAPSPVPAHQP